MYIAIKRRRSKKEPFGFQLVGDNGEILIPVEGYTRKANVFKLIHLIIQHVTPSIEIRDYTTKEKPYTVVNADPIEEAPQV